MPIIFRSLKADFIKMKNTPFYWLHLGIPFLGIVAFVIWGYFDKIDDLAGKTGAYLQVISMAFPMAIGIVCPIVIEQEASAGRFKEMLGCVYGKPLSLISKLLLLMFSGFFSTIIAFAGFFSGYRFILHQSILPVSFYGYIILIVFGSQIFLYMLHTWLSLLWGSGASIGIGIFETLIAALMETGLGEGVWQWLPCGWCMRFSDYFLVKFYVLNQPLSKFPDFIQGVKNSIVFTIIFGMAFVIWFGFYEGRKEI